MRRSFGLLLALSILFIIFSTPAWAVLSCGPGIGLPLVRLSSATNAHVEPNPSPSGYAIGIGCSDPAIGLNVTLDSSASGVEILRLSTLSNAHAELPGLVPQNYTNLIKVNDNLPGNLDVQTTSDNDCDALNGGALNYVPFLHLSHTSNAHAEQPSGSPAYQNTICLAYNGTGVNPQDDIVQTSLTGGVPTILLGQSAAMNIVTTNLQAGDAQYTNIATFNVTAICPVGVGDCDTLTDYAAFSTAISDMANGAYTGSIIPASLAVKKFGNTSAFQNNLVSGLISNYSVSVNTLGALDTVTNAGNPDHTSTYTIDTQALGLAGGAQYRVISADWRGSFVFPSGGSTWNENTTTTNFDSYIFAVGSLCGTPSAQCTIPGASPGGCPILTQTCDLFCMCIDSGPPTGTAGDVFILRDIKFPNVYQNADIVADVTVENKRMDLTTSGTITFIIRDSKGALVPGFSTPTNFSFSSSMETVRLTLQNPCSGASCAFNTGETYTLYATAVKFNDPDPNPPNLSETIIANNSGYKTFTTLEAPQTYSIPDSPWWMSVLVFGMIAGWLFISARKNEQ